MRVSGNALPVQLSKRQGNVSVRPEADAGVDAQLVAVSALRMRHLGVLARGRATGRMASPTYCDRRKGDTVDGASSKLNESRQVHETPPFIFVSRLSAVNGQPI
jgi:hypothetical protein